jgi:hypothetical protein
MKPLGETVAIHDDGWALHRRVGNTRDPWRVFVLVSPEGVDRKQRFYCGWNGERLSRGGDVGILHGRHPKVFEWLCEALLGVDRVEDFQRRF